MARAVSQHFSLCLEDMVYITTLANLLQPKLLYLVDMSSLLLIMMLTLSRPHVAIVSLSYLVEKVPAQELVSTRSLA